MLITSVFIFLSFCIARPSKRWNHTMCLCDPDTAVLIGGETAEQNYFTDSVWKLEIGVFSPRPLVHLLGSDSN